MAARVPAGGGHLLVMGQCLSGCVLPVLRRMPGTYCCCILQTAVCILHCIYCRLHLYTADCTCILHTVLYRACSCTASVYCCTAPPQDYTADTANNSTRSCNTAEYSVLWCINTAEYSVFRCINTTEYSILRCINTCS